MKNRIEKRENGYILICEDGQEFDCRRWFEKKTSKWYICPDKDGVKLCGRQYISEKFLDNVDFYEFETKTEHREGLGNGGWKNRLTDDEKVEYESLEKRMNELKELALSRPVQELTEEEKLLKQIEKLQKKLKGIQG